MDFCTAAKELGCHPAAIKAVALVESPGKGFDDSGKIIIRFEGHKFRSFTNGKYDKSHPKISYGYSQSHNKNHGYTAFNEAFALNKDAAMLATSWGRFQPMGFTHEEAGFDDVGKFVDFLKASEGNQLIAFIRLVKHRGLADELRRARKSDFANFAKMYNGASYKDNDYDTKMYNYYIKFKKENFDCTDAPSEILEGGTEKATSELESNDITTDDGAVETTNTEVVNTDEGAVTSTTEQKNEQDVNTSAEVAQPKPYNGIGFMPTIKKDFAAVTGGNLTFQGLSEYFQQASGWPDWLVAVIWKLALVVAIISALWLAFRLIHYLVYRIGEWQRTRIEAAAKTNPLSRDIIWTKT